MRKKDETLRETLLDLAREIVDDGGADALSIRALAKRAGVAGGTIYNYFADKEDILLALTEEYWRDTLDQMRGAINARGFLEQLREVYAFLRARIDHSGGMLMGSLRSAQSAGRQRMRAMQAVLRSALIERMRMDDSIGQDAFGTVLTEEGFADFIIANMTMLLGANTANIDFFIEIVGRILYLKEHTYGAGID